MKNLITILFAISAFFASTQVIKNVDAETFKKLMADKNTVLIDLRTTGEITSKGKIKGAKQIDFLGKDAEAEIKALDHKKTYLIYCAGGGRSGDCAEMMEKQGFKQVINLEKGFEDWKRKGFEIEK